MSDQTVTTEIIIQLGGQGAQAVATAERLGDASKRARSEIQALNRAAARTAQPLRAAGAEADDLAQAMKRVGTEAQKAANATDKVGKGGGKGVNVGGALSGAAQLAPGGVGDLLRTASDIEGVVGALGGLGPVAIAGGVAMAGVAVVLGGIEEAARKAREAAQNYVDELARERGIKLAVLGLQDESPEALSQRQRDLQAQEKIWLQDKDDLLKKINANEQAYADLGASLNVERRRALIEERDVFRKSLEEVDKQLQDIGGQIVAGALASDPARARADNEAAVKAITDRSNLELKAAEQGKALTQEQLDARIDALQAESQAARATKAELQALLVSDPTNEAAKQQIEDLNAVIARNETETEALVNITEPLVQQRTAEAAAAKLQKEALENATKAVEEYNTNAEKLTDLEKERTEALADRAREEARAGQIGELETRIAAAKEAEAMQEREAKVADIRREGANEEAAILRRGQDDLTALDRDFLAERLKAQQDYAREAARSEEDFGRERLRKLQDLNASLTELAAQGDVAAFVRTQRSGLQDIARGDEDFGVEQRRRLEDFQREQQERAAEYAVRRAERQTQLQQELEENRAATQQKLEQERQANQTRMTESQRLEQELATLKQRFAEEDKARSRQLEDQKYRDEVAAIRKRNAELLPVLQKSMDPAVQAVKNLGTAAANEFNRLISIFKSGGGSGGGGRSRRLASGLDYVPYDEYPALLHRGEMVLNAQRAEAMRSTGADGPITVTVNATVGRVATPEDLQALEATVYQGVARAMQRRKGRG